MMTTTGHSLAFAGAGLPFARSRVSSPDPLELLASLVEIPSLSRDEDRIAAHLFGWFQEHDIEAVRLGDNVIARVHGQEPGPTILLNSHLDTVPASEEWTCDPWTPTTRNGVLTGLGANDAKASVAGMACATVQTARAGLGKGCLIFAATCMEEVGGGGLEMLLPELGHLDAAIVGEPTSLDVALAQNGLLILEAETFGQSAHAAHSHKAVNALTIAARDLVALSELRLDKAHALLGGSTVNVTVVHGGERHNVIPDRCRYTIDVRYTPSYDPDELITLVDDLVSAEISARSSRLRPVSTSPDADIVKVIRSVHPKAELFGSPTLSDCTHLGGIDAVKFGPGDSCNSHTPDEWVEIAQVEQAVSFYSDCVLRFTELEDGERT